jgi:hypothetical protein
MVPLGLLGLGDRAEVVEIIKKLCKPAINNLGSPLNLARLMNG